MFSADPMSSILQVTWVHRPMETGGGIPENVIHGWTGDEAFKLKQQMKFHCVLCPY